LETTLTSEREKILREFLGSCDISGRAGSGTSADFLVRFGIQKRNSE
jgi:hypothetical protein